MWSRISAGMIEGSEAHTFHCLVRESLPSDHQERTRRGPYQASEVAFDAALEVAPELVATELAARFAAGSS